jgi:hypothetical protein
MQTAARKHYGAAPILRQRAAIPSPSLSSPSRRCSGREVAPDGDAVDSHEEETRKDEIDEHEPPAESELVGDDRPHTLEHVGRRNAAAVACIHTGKTETG